MIDLETKLSHQELIIEELQQALLEHHTALSKLEKNLKSLNDRFEVAVGGGPEIGPANEKPPHY